MHTTWKYQLEHVTNTFSMPSGAQVLTVQIQRGEPCLWALVNPAQPYEERTFRIYGAGHEIEEQWIGYIGTVQMLGGSLVWHVFEVWPSPESE